MADYANSILEAIEYGANKAVDNAKFDRTLICTVKRISANNVATVQSGGFVTDVLFINNASIKINDRVHLCIPRNNYLDKYLLEDLVTVGNGTGGGGSGGGSIGIIDASQIRGLDEYIKKNASGTKIAMTIYNNLPQNQSSGDIWYEVKKYRNNSGVTTDYEGGV